EDAERLAFSPDGKRLASGSSNDARGGPEWYGAVSIWEVQKDTNPVTLKIQGTNGAISSDFKHLASASRNDRGNAQDNTVMIWDAASGRRARTLEGHTNTIFSLAFSPDGKRLASGDGVAPGQGGGRLPGLVKIWDVQTGQELFTLKGHTNSVRGMAFSPDGKR